MVELIRVYEPSTPEREDIAVVTCGQLGSSLHHDHGRDSDNIMQNTGLPVIATERPGSGLYFPKKGLKSALADGYVQEIVGVAREVGRAAEALGVEKLVFTGRSAGALGALALAATELLPVHGVYGAEAVGWTAASPEEVKNQLKEYNARQREIIDSDKDVVRPEPTDTTGLTKIRRALSIPFLAMTDIYHNTGVYGSTVARECAELVLRQPGSEVVLEFAEDSMVINDELLDYHKAQLQKIAQDNGSHLVMEKVPGTVHASYDLRKFFVERLILSGLVNKEQ